MIKTLHINQIQGLIETLKIYLESHLEDVDVQMELSYTLLSYSRLIDSVEERELSDYILNSSVELNGFSALSTKPEQY